MKYTLSILALLLSVMVGANKYGVVDSDYILSKLQDYKTAETQVEEFAKRCQDKIAEEYNKLEDLQFEYTKNEFLFSPELKKRKKDDITKQRQKAKQVEKSFFGKNGELERKRQELIRPIQNRLYDAIRQVANDGNYHIVFDVSENYGILYSNRKIDISDEVLEILNEK